MTTPNDAAAGTASSENGAGAGNTGAGGAGTSGNTKVSVDASATQSTGAGAGAGAANEYHGTADKYSAPQGSTYSQAFNDELHAAAKDLGLNQKGLDKLYGVAGRHMKSVQQEFDAAHSANTKQWLEAVTNDKEIGGDRLDESRAIAAKGMDFAASPELRAIMKESGLENHPEFLRAFYRVGKAVSEDKFVRGGGSQNGEKSPLFTYDKSDHQAS